MHMHLFSPHVCRVSGNMFACPMLHFRRLVFPWTDPSLGNCSYLDTCRHMRTCKYIHYEINDEADLITPDMMARQDRPPVPSYLEVLLTWLFHCLGLTSLLCIRQPSKTDGSLSASMGSVCSCKAGQGLIQAVHLLLHDTLACI